MALEPAEGRHMFESFYPCPVRNPPPRLWRRVADELVWSIFVFQDQTAQDPSAINMFITGLSPVMKKCP